MESGPPREGPQSPVPPPQAPAYGGPVPPGGWERPVAPAPPGLAGRPLASWGSRVGASLLDGLILAIPTGILIAIVIAVFLSGSDIAGITIGVISLLAFLVVTVLYAPLLMMRPGAHNGQSWGKQIVGIRVVRDNARPFDLGSAFLREFVIKNLLFGWVGGWFAGIPTLLDYLWPLWDDQNRCLHDMVCSTHVVRA